VSAITATFHPEDLAREVVTWLHDRIEAASTIDSVFLLIALAIVYFLIKSVMAVTRVGPVEVELLECDSGNNAEVHALTAALRERLANGGLPAPVVPSGAPQVSLVAAVAASSIPQAGFVAKLVEAAPIPAPPRFRLSGTLFQKNHRPGISFWLRPDRGRALMKTIIGAPRGRAVSYDDTIREAAFAVYSFITTEATQAFPTWARWRSAEALEAYAQGSEAALAGDFQQARASLARAIEQEPDNALVSLQLANVYERLAREGAAGDTSELESGLTADEQSAKRRAVARSQAEALRRYLWIADEWAWLVQARYRASVLAGSLAAACVDDDARLGACDGLGLPPDAKDRVKSIVETIALSESKFARQLLKPWYMLVRWRRLRSQFEPSAEERRHLKRAVGISKHCRRLRSSRPDEALHRRFAKWVMVRYSEVAVRFWHLSFGLIKVDWQTHYVAACFEALLLERAQKRDPGAAEV
jgi:hypothetical protein